MSKTLIEDRSITTRILRSLYDDVTDFVKSSTKFSNEADFIRDATREKLEKETKK
jgi:Arc/MetJ-type ribon-helix-helix transcriptional regulator